LEKESGTGVARGFFVRDHRLPGAPRGARSVIAFPSNSAREPIELDSVASRVNETPTSSTPRGVALTLRVEPDLVEQTP